MKLIRILQTVAIIISLTPGILSGTLYYDTHIELGIKDYKISVNDIEIDPIWPLLLYDKKSISTSTFYYTYEKVQQTKVLYENPEDAIKENRIILSNEEPLDHTKTIQEVIGRTLEWEYSNLGSQIWLNRGELTMSNESNFKVWKMIYCYYSENIDNDARIKKESVDGRDPVIDIDLKYQKVCFELNIHLNYKCSKYESNLYRVWDFFFKLKNLEIIAKNEKTDPMKKDMHSLSLLYDKIMQNDKSVKKDIIIKVFNHLSVYDCYEFYPGKKILYDYRYITKSRNEYEVYIEVFTQLLEGNKLFIERQIIFELQIGEKKIEAINKIKELAEKDKEIDDNKTFEEIKPNKLKNTSKRPDFVPRLKINNVENGINSTEKEIIEAGVVQKANSKKKNS
jgi:hypothetical protein